MCVCVCVTGSFTRGRNSLERYRCRIDYNEWLALLWKGYRYIYFEFSIRYIVLMEKSCFFFTSQYFSLHEKISCLEAYIYIHVRRYTYICICNSIVTFPLYGGRSPVLRIVEPLTNWIFRFSRARARAAYTFTFFSPLQSASFLLLCLFFFDENARPRVSIIFFFLCFLYIKNTFFIFRFGLSFERLINFHGRSCLQLICNIASSRRYNPRSNYTIA